MPQHDFAGGECHNFDLQYIPWNMYNVFWAPSQYPKRRLSVRSRKVSKPRDLYLELSDRSEIWQALRQQCCRCACQISKRYDNLKYQSRGFETLRDLTKRRLFGYGDGAQVALWLYVSRVFYAVCLTLSCRVTSLAPGQYYDCPNAGELS